MSLIIPCVGPSGPEFPALLLLRVLPLMNEAGTSSAGVVRTLIASPYLGHRDLELFTSTSGSLWSFSEGPKRPECGSIEQRGNGAPSIKGGFGV